MDIKCRKSFSSIYKKVKNHEDITNAQFNCLGIIVKFLKKVGVKKQLIKIKQPNDILIDNKKICGILVESIRYKKSIFDSWYWIKFNK